MHYSKNKRNNELQTNSNYINYDSNNRKSQSRKSRAAIGLGELNYKATFEE